MADLGVKLTDQRMLNLSKRLEEVYNEAYKTAVQNNQASLNKLSKLKEEIEKGKYSNEPEWKTKQRLEQATMAEIRTSQIVNNTAKEINNAGDMAAKIIKGELTEVFALNYDFSNYSILRQSNVDYSFSQYDRNQIAVLVSEKEPPFTKIAYKKLGSDPDVVRRLQNQLMQATINGESQGQIIKRIKDITGQNTKKAKRVAQTERTRVQTQGRMMSINEAEKIGIEMDKQWNARMIRTRKTHMDAHEEIVGSKEKFSNGLEFPGDPNGPANEVINCHCYIKPMVKSVSPALAKHRARVANRDFERYRKEVN